MALYLLAQGIPALPGQVGTVTGVLHDRRQLPAAGVRVAAMPVPDSVQALVEGAVLVSISQTDAAGRYRLEDIPPGRYFIIAGRVDVPTFHPGTLEMAKGTVVQMTPGDVLTGIDFILMEDSLRSTASSGVKAFNIPLQVTVEGVGKFAATSPMPYLVLTRIGDGIRRATPLDEFAISLLPTPRDYRVTVENLAAGYTVKSLRFGAVDLMKDSIQLPPPSSVSSGASGTSTPIQLMLSLKPVRTR